MINLEFLTLIFFRIYNKKIVISLVFGGTSENYEILTIQRSHLCSSSETRTIFDVHFCPEIFHCVKNEKIVIKSFFQIIFSAENPEILSQNGRTMLTPFFWFFTFTFNFFPFFTINIQFIKIILTKLPVSSAEYINFSIDYIGGMSC